jgi:hypothetical protein
VTRRIFLAVAARLLAAQGPVRIRLVGDHAGATLALDEMQRTASLLGRSVERDNDASMVIELAEKRLITSGTSYSVSASPAAQAAALREWNGPPARAAVEWHPDLAKYGAEQLNARFLRRFGTAMDADGWMAWMLVRIAVDVQLRGAAIESSRFDGHKGAPLAFGPDGHLRQPLCLVDAAGGLLGVSG